MEEDINYSSVVFKNGDRPPKENNEELTVYAEVKTKGPVPRADGEAAAAHSGFPVLAVCSGILSVLLVASIGAIIYSEFHVDTLVSLVMSQQKANLSDLTAENQRLITERSVFERETKELSRVTDNLNWTLGFILKFKTFPVVEYCPEKKCQPCMREWILFQEKCYLFYNENPPWKTWFESRKHCQDKSADLVVIGSLQEQEFISNNTKPYFDKAHGYWMGLSKTDDKYWIWVDGSKDTLGYWAGEEIGTPGSHGLFIPGINLTASWDPADFEMLNKFICESDALIRAK